MKRIPWLALICSVCVIGTAQTATANNLNFQLDRTQTAIAATQPSAPSPDQVGQTIAQAEVPLPEAAAAPAPDPLGEANPSPAAVTNPEPPLSSAPDPLLSIPPSNPEPAPAVAPPMPSSAPAATPKPQRPAPDRTDVALYVGQPPSSSDRSTQRTEPPPVTPPTDTPVKSAAMPVAMASQPLPTNPDPLFTGGADSIVARTVGHAEGTRTADGQKTTAYYGHIDPGNAKWNLGSFSYQHCDKTCTPEIADDRQLARLKRQTETIQQLASAENVNLTIEEALNGIDLANQAPLAALEPSGYIAWLKAARQKGLTGSDAVLWARTWSFLNPQTQTWDAPGLGNQYDSINHDQDRRLTAIARALAKYEAESN